MKKIFATLAALILALTFSVAAFADDTVYTEGTLYYTVANDSITITGCFGKDAEVTVPAMIAGTPVNTIGSGAFTSNEYVRTLYLPDTISKIENGAIADGISVIYNANTDHPQTTPTDLILGRLDPVPAVPGDNPVVVPTEEPAVTPPVGSGTEEDNTPAPTYGPGSAGTSTETSEQDDEVTQTVIGEADYDDEDPGDGEQPADESSSEAKSEEPAPTEPAAGTSETGADSEKTNVIDTEEGQGQTAGTKVQPAVILGIIIAAAVVCCIVVLVVRKVKTK